ncbi:disulfide oxidoreductase [Heyndrickxia acidicola]|uniref:Probable disulfide formation protein n=1 Tax=Heyndrickxia acidicola TaxID=209389 RepID=A0ABU6MGI7_9BACI|nr:disulfide oxidoreductase [Heyndrickxia acidicola]MED1202382.1 disulfide oxidoreductase [Heyndrickxia acidicola]
MSKYLGIAWIAAIFSMSGSLFFSEVMNFVPCTLCWYQRILMYPLVFILGVAVYKRDFRVYRYVMPLSGIGMLISLYHYSIQKIPFMREVQICKSGIPCTEQYINWLGFITIPLLALVGFIIITVSMFLLRKQFKKSMH